MKLSAVLVIAAALAATAPCAFCYPSAEDGQASRPSPGPYKEVWRNFYNAGSEGALTPALIEGGRKMVPHVCQAVRDHRMFARRYALGALGHLKDRRAILTLETIYADTDEDSLFRGDALEAIFIIDQELGRLYARNVLKRSLPELDFLRSTAKRIFESPQQLLERPVAS